VFVVGGGGKITGFVETLAEYLDLPVDRVALRGSEVMGNIEFLQKEICVDSLLVTPVGICLNYYEQKNNFIFVTVNGERIKLYDNSKLSVVDAAMQVGYPNEDLFPKRGEALEYTVNGEKRMRRGASGEAAVVKLNGKEAALSDALAQNDKIEIIASTQGEAARMTVEELPEYHANMEFTFNKKKIKCPRFVKVNGELVSGFYDIQEDDRVEVVDYYTLEQILEFMDILYRGKIYVNNALAEMDTKVYDNFSVACEIKKEEPNYIKLMEEYGEGQVPDAVLTGESEEVKRLEEHGYEVEDDDELSEEFSDEESVDDSLEEEFSEEETAEGTADADDTEGEPSNASKGQPASQVAAPPVSENIDLHITVNGETVILKNKKSYILVDVLDFYPFDLTVAGGDKLETLVNGISSEFTKPLGEGDEVRIFWK
jgi:sulfur carrier protein ThiS